MNRRYYVEWCCSHRWSTISLQDEVGTPCIYFEVLEGRIAFSGTIILWSRQACVSQVVHFVSASNKTTPPNSISVPGANQPVILQQQELSHALGLSVGSRRRIQPNPAAGDVRSREYRHSPWMQLTNRQIEAENLKGESVIFEKRVFDLAKQAVASLQGEAACCPPLTKTGSLYCCVWLIDSLAVLLSSLIFLLDYHDGCSLCCLPSLAPVGVGVRSCEMTTVANTIRTACKFRALQKEQQRELPEPKRVSGGNGQFFYRSRPFHC